MQEEYELISVSDKRERLMGFFTGLGIGVSIIIPLFMGDCILDPTFLNTFSIIFASMGSIAFGLMGFVLKSEKLVWRKICTSHPAATRGGRGK